MLFGSHTRVATYGGTGKKATVVSVRLLNLDDPEHPFPSKFPQDWSIGQPVRIIPNDEAVTIAGVTYPAGSTYLDAKNPANPDPDIYLGSVYSGKAEQMIKAGCPEAELPDRDVRGLDGMIFDVETKDELYYPGAKQSTKRLVPVKYHGRGTKEQIEAAVAKFNEAQAATPAEAAGNGQSADAALLAAAPAATPVNTATATDVGEAEKKFLTELAAEVAKGPVPAQGLVGLIVKLFANDDAAKRGLVPIYVNPVESKKRIEAAGLKHTGTEITL